jgi:hypothetical protein
MENPEEGTMIDSNKSETRLEEYHQRTRRENLFRKGRTHTHEAKTEAKYR